MFIQKSSEAAKKEEAKSFPNWHVKRNTDDVAVSWHRVRNWKRPVDMDAFVKISRRKEKVVFFFGFLIGQELFCASSEKPMCRRFSSQVVVGQLLLVGLFTFAEGESGFSFFFVFRSRTNGQEAEESTMQQKVKSQVKFISKTSAMFSMLPPPPPPPPPAAVPSSLHFAWNLLAAYLSPFIGLLKVCTLTIPTGSRHQRDNWSSAPSQVSDIKWLLRLFF